jgi:rhamnosyltransferase subunit B
MADRRQILVVTLGTEGDARPFIDLAAELQDRSCDVTVASNADHAGYASQKGVAFEAVCEPDWPQVGRDDSLFFQRVIETAYPAIDRIFSTMMRRNPRTVAVVRTGMWGALFSAERCGMPVIRLALQPCAIRRGGHPIDPEDLKKLNRFRATLGLQSCSGENGLDETSALATISLFPPWFGHPQSDWNESGVCVGFPLAVPAPRDHATADVRAFLDRFGAPIVFTCGTGVQEVRHFLDVAVDYARTGRSALFLSKHVGRPPIGLPETILVRDYVDHGALFPRARAVIHNGGIGVIARSISAAVPQVVVPLMYDQPDNAQRVERLGLGCTVLPENLQVETVSAALEKLGNDHLLTDRLQRFAADVAATAALSNAADLIERHLRSV